ncbi:hypothetical protein LPJ66_006305 [Kickxella alabastrina]|uniref:Uncharacterized protein n=1 Tax=Kickxella alabastrina TaxID=61397 RepID=A0ACC1IFV3_9FUNG|nr:hypothetical protein LPJ66_006305 [Kickxella alabastrina]
MPTLKDGEWKCTVCDIKNSKDVFKCAACESPKPASASTAASAVTSAAPAPAAVQLSADLAKQNAGSVDVSQLPVFSFDLDVLKKPAAPFAPAAVPNLWAQSGFKMPALKDGATLYLDPLLHALGVPSSFNILDSHIVLSALLAGASGIMAYTSIGVLTKESMEYLSELTNWPLVAKYPGAMVAILFVTGAHLNLLLARLVTYLTPQDSPIKHTCASHPPSPNAELHLHEGSIGDDRTSLSANILDAGLSSIVTTSWNAV